jgi:hypothetical protein
MGASRRTLNYTAWSITPVAAVTTALALFIGKSGLLFAGLMALPWFAWRYDNETGAFFPLPYWSFSSSESLGCCPS